MTTAGYPSNDPELHWTLVEMLKEFFDAHGQERSWDHIHMWAARFERLIERGADPVDDLLREAGMRGPTEKE